MKAEDLRRAIELPSRRAGLRVEPALVDASSPTSSTSRAACLCSPLRWSSSGNTVTVGPFGSTYRESGGVRGAVARIAEDAYTGFTPAQQETARRILLRLASVEGDDAVRRRAPLAELELETNEDAGHVVTLSPRAVS